MAETITAFYNLNSHVLVVRGLRNADTGALVSSGVTVTATLCAEGTSTPLVTTPPGGSAITLSAVSGEPGEYHGTFGTTVADVMVLGTRYDIILTANGGAALTGVWRIRLRVIERAL